MTKLDRCARVRDARVRPQGDFLSVMQRTHIAVDEDAHFL